MINFDEYLMNTVKTLDLKSTGQLYSEINKITKDICVATNVSRASVWLYGEDNNSIRCESLYLLNDKVHEKKGSVLFKKDFEPYFKAMESERIIMANDAHTHHATSCFSEVYLKPLGIVSMYDTPIWKADEVIGVLCLEYLTPKNNWSIEEKNYLTSMADFLAKIYEKNSVLELVETLEQKVKQRTQELELALNDLKKTQAFMVQREKLASLGTVVAGVAHELRNPISHVVTSSELIPELLSDEDVDLDDIKEVAEIIRSSGLRAESIIKDMLSQSVDNEEVSNESLNKVIEFSYKLALHGFNSKDPSLPAITIKAEEEYFCYMAKQKFQRLFINLFENSLFSIRKKILAGFDFKPEVYVSISLVKELYILEIVDNGLGIKEEIITKIFEPFYTTKGVDGGSGLGMSIVYDIVKSHNGDIRIESTKDVKTKIIIELPKGEVHEK